MEFGNFFKGKKILVTGHTGFKGAWLSIWLKELGADVIGYSIDVPYPNSIFELSKLKNKIVDIRGDVRDFDELKSVYLKYKPDIVFHLAAQAIVRLSYSVPRETFDTNFMGIVNILECIREHPVKSAVLITSDKCYKNVERRVGYVETDAFSDQDPYSCSKGCAEMAAQSYRNSFDVKVATTRAGNVIGGGDWGTDRLVPDVMKALKTNKDIIIRNPNSIRPWQFVLEPLHGYLILAQKQYNGEGLSEGWNFGPDRKSMVPVRKLVKMIISKWGSGRMIIKEDNTYPEASILYLKNIKSRKRLGWKPKLDINETLKYVVEWYKEYESTDVYGLCVKQIKKYDAQ